MISGFGRKATLESNAGDPPCGESTPLPGEPCLSVHAGLLGGRALADWICCACCGLGETHLLRKVCEALPHAGAYVGVIRHILNEYTLANSAIIVKVSLNRLLGNVDRAHEDC